MANIMISNFTGKFTGKYLLFYYILLPLHCFLDFLLYCIIDNYKCVLICLNITILVPLRVRVFFVKKLCKKFTELFLFYYWEFNLFHGN